MDDRDQLYDLLLAIFRTDEELRRFLVLEQILPTESRSINLQPVPSKANTAFSTVDLLLKRDLVDRRLFDALLRRNPEREHDIRAVADFYLGAADDAAATSDDSSSEEVPAEYAKFIAQLDADLAAVDMTAFDPMTKALDDAHWPWTAVASVLGRFRPAAIAPLKGHDSALSATDALADLIFTSTSGSWVIEDVYRIACLRRLHESHLLTAAIDANAALPDSRRDLLQRLVEDSGPVPVAVMSSAELNDLDAVTEWLEAAGIPSPISRADVEAAVERRWLIDPLRTLVGTHFMGRSRELATVYSCVAGRGRMETLSIRGPGGAGKSTLMGKILLDLEDRHSFDPVAFAYVDFDKGRHDPRDASALLGQIARQLRLLYATSAGNAAEFAALESYSSNTDMDVAADLLDIPTDLDAPALTEVLAQRLLALAERGDGDWPPLILVLDTCEEVLAKGPGAVRDLVQMVTRLRETIPGMRLITAGRSVIDEFESDTRSARIELGDLDRKSADALLEALGVSAKQVRKAVVDRFGGNPLTLRLAAQALTASGDAHADVNDLTPVRSLAEISLEQVQGMLYARILGHIADREVAAVAHPGLVVRRITVPVLQEILAGPCHFDPAAAPDLFRRLGRELSMFEPEGDDTLRHRSDVRRLMLRTILDDARRAVVVREIHDRAVDFYSRRTSNEAKAEEIYHRLMRGDDPRTLDALWQSEFARLLDDVLEEPLSDAARSWLTRRVRHDDPAGDLADWNQYDWEANAASRATSWLSSHSPEDALEVLRERSMRLPGSRLYELEVDAHLMLNDADKAARALEKGMRSAARTEDRTVQLELAERAIRVKAIRQDWAGVDEAARSCLAITDVTGETLRGVHSLTAAIDALRDAPVQRDALGAELSRRFVRLTRDELRSDPETARRAVVTATDSTVLVHAAREVGDRAGQPDGVYLDDAFALTRLLDGMSSDAEPALAALATEVGISGTSWHTDELARRALRTGRSGAAISLGLEYAADEASAHQLVVNDLTPSVDLM